MTEALTVWLALDVDSPEEAERLMARVPGHRHFKVGMQLFYRAGPEPVRRWIERGYRIFLDLKLLDIPRTVGQGVAAARHLGVDLLTVHVLGGSEMLAAAAEQAGSVAVIGVTVVTSASPETLAEVGITDPLSAVAERYVRLARTCGLAGVVVSGLEAEAASAAWPGSRIVVPGVRLAGDSAHDQARVMDPLAAARAGATDLVIGRAVSWAPDPAARYGEIVRQLREGGYAV